MQYDRKVLYAFPRKAMGTKKKEVDFLKSKGVKMLEGKGNHGETIDEFIKEGVELLK